MKKKNRLSNRNNNRTASLTEKFKDRFTRYPIIIRLLLIILIIILILINLPLVILFWILLACYKTLKKEYSSFSWPTTKGFIDTSYIHKFRDSEGDKMYSAKIKYSYFVMETEYHSNRISFSKFSVTSWRRDAAKKVDRYPVGKKVSVYYDATNPDQAVLEPGFKWYTPILYGIPLFFVVIPIALIVQLSVWLMIFQFLSTLSI